MKKSYYEIEKRGKIVIWGTGRIMHKYIDRINPKLDIIGFCDSFPKNWGTCPVGNLPCFSKDKIRTEHTIIIAIEAKGDVEIVQKELERRGIDYCHIFEAADAYKDEWEKVQIEKFEKKYHNMKCKKIVDYHKIIKFINCHVPYKACNLKCEYCYIKQNRNFYNNELKLYSPAFIAKALSPLRLGGIAFINFCAGGETLLVKEIIPIVAELVKDGHYIQIVTNGTIDRAFDELLQSKIDFKHIFIKFSYHYKELVRVGKIDSFYNNVKRMRKAGCSVSVELVASDDLIPLIDEIKESSMTNLGALPHLTIPRDDTSKELKLLTKLSREEYYNIWSSFDSIMFKFKWDNLNLQRFENCMAGKWSFAMDLESGNVNKCLSNPYLDNIYNNISDELYLEAVGNACTLPYCYNCHAYLTFGLIEEVKAPTYYTVRNRTTKEGESWITDELKAIFEQKLYINNQ